MTLRVYPNPSSCSLTPSFFDHVRHDIKIVSHVRINEDLEREYNNAVSKIDDWRTAVRPLVLPDELIKPPHKKRSRQKWSLILQGKDITKQSKNVLSTFTRRRHTSG
ncbi:MAG: hypothetical protein CM1200mP35_06100 [Chloroflexota bacterium]|nr:MAG: hypothetical protein CM1200mP35_06100 [Chloroflexota bacterium]